MDTFASRTVARCGMSDGVHASIGEFIIMGKLVSRKVYRLYIVSEKPDKRGKYQLGLFDKKTFNKEIDEDKIEDTLTDLVNYVYYRQNGCCWFDVCINDDSDEGKTFCTTIDNFNRLEIQNITNMIDLVPGSFLFYILVNGIRTECRWVVASIHTVYSD